MSFSQLPLFPRSNVLILGANSIQSLLPSTLISQIEALLESHRLEDATTLADQRRKKLEDSLTVDLDEKEEIKYVYQRIGFQCLSETLFEDAGKHLFHGELDPRLLVSYYPDLKGGLFSEDSTTDVFAGVAERMPKEKSVDDIIMSNLVRNYSPHLEPDTFSAPPTAELRKILSMASREMLLNFLKKNRIRRSVARGLGTASIGDMTDVTIDTVLVKLYAEFERTEDLYEILHGPNDVALAEVEEVLVRTGQYSALCMLYEKRQETDKLLEAWAKLADGVWTDPEVRDPLSHIVDFIVDKRDKSLIQRWGLWLTKRDPDRGLKLLMSREIGKRKEKTEDDMAMLQEIEEASPDAGLRYLEYLVLKRRSSSRDLHMRLAHACVNEVFRYLNDDSVSKLWRAKAASYASSRSDNPFLTYFVSTTPQSPHKRARLKLILFLAGSTFYDPEPIRQRLTEKEKLLKLELAIIDGKLGRHRAALNTLIHDYGDSKAAETYCTLAGDIVPPKLAQFIADDSVLHDWASPLFSLPPGPASKPANGSNSKAAAAAAPSPPTLTRLKTVNDTLKRELIKVLLEVYMTNNQSERAAQLLNAQAMNLDPLDVLSLVPPDWPVQLLSTFLARSFRRGLHAEHEGNIIKNISAGQNLETKLSTWPILREEGAIVEEEAEADADDDDTTHDEKGDLEGENSEEDDEGAGAEPRSFNEKHVPLGLEGNIAVEISATDIVPGSFDENRHQHQRKLSSGLNLASSERPTRTPDGLTTSTGDHHPIT